jgi:hypothetical protein
MDKVFDQNFGGKLTGKRHVNERGRKALRRRF